MKYLAEILALLIGSLLGFFGVLVSVFADGGNSERLVTIAAILLFYFVLSGLWAFLQPRRSWSWGGLLGLPGVMMLGLYVLVEFNPWYIVYGAAILVFSGLGACLGGFIRARRQA